MSRDALARATVSRRVTRTVVALVVVGLAVHVVAPQLGELDQAIGHLRSGKWRFLGLTILGVATSYVAGAWMVRTSVGLPLPVLRTTLSQVAASFMAIVTPAGLGWVGVTDSYIRKAGADNPTAHTATGVNMIVTFLSHVVLLVTLLPLAPTLNLPAIRLPSVTTIAEVVAAGLAALGIILWIPASRRRILGSVADLRSVIPRVVGDPKRTLLLACGAVLANLALATALAGAIASFGARPPFLGVTIAYLIAATIASIAPTPGGLGAMEAALIAVLTRLGLDLGTATASALTFRLFSFWLILPAGGAVWQVGRRKGWL